MSTFRVKGPYQPLETFAFGVRGIIATPASDSARNGWGEPYEDSEGEPIEPGTIGGPNPQSLLKEPKNDADDWQDRRKPKLSGNVDWRGPGGEVLSWYGSPTRYFDFVPHFGSTNTGEIWPGQTTWQSPTDPDNPTPALSNVTSYNTVARVTPSGQFQDGFGYIDTGTVYRKGKAYFEVPGPNRVAGCGLKTLELVDETWLYFVYFQAGGYNNADILARVKVPFDFDSPAIEQIAVMQYGLEPTLLFGNQWNFANTSPWFFNQSCSEAVAIRKRQVNVNGVLTPVAHLMRIIIAQDGAAEFLDGGVCQTSKADALITFEKQFLGSEIVGPETVEHYVNNQVCAATYGGQTIVAADWDGDTMILATVSTTGSVAWTDGHFYQERYDTATGNPIPTPLPTEDFQGSFTDTLVETIAFDRLLPNLTVAKRTNTASMNGLTTASPPDERATSYGTAVETQIKYLDLRYGILHVKQTGHDNPIVIELDQESRADSYARERIYVDGILRTITVNEAEADYLYYPADPDPITLAHIYEPVFGDTNPPDPTAPTVSGQFLKDLFWVPAGSVAPYESTLYTQPLGWLRIAFAAVFGLSPSADNVLVSFPVWPEREVDQIDRGTWLDNRQFYSAIIGTAARTEAQLKALTESVGEFFRLHLAGTAGK